MGGLLLAGALGAGRYHAAGCGRRGGNRGRCTAGTQILGTYQRIYSGHSRKLHCCDGADQ